ncbi:DNA polymerase III subunit beta [Thermosulfidibacter takaii]|nr:DNA polymerase III subunit beta [Thermosulfidibacter takaii]
MGKCLTDKGSLQSALMLIQGVIEKKAINPVLTSVVFETVGDDVLRLKATNLEESILVNTWAEVHEPINLAVSAKRLFEFVRELPDLPISIEVDESGTLNLSVERIRATFPTLDVEEFPDFPAKPESTLLLSRDVFLDALDKVYYSIAADAVSMPLMGMLFKKEGDVLHFVSTDGHRLSLVERSVEGLEAHDFEMIIPRKGVQEIRKVLERKVEVDAVEVGFSENHCYVKAGNVEIFSRVLEGRYPNYKRVVPEEFDKEFIVSTKEFMQAAKRVSLFSEDKVRGIRIEFRPDESLIVVSSMVSSGSGFSGAASQEIEIADVSGTNFVFGLNAKYLMEALSAFDSETVRVSTGEALWPVKLTSEEVPYYLHIIMPLKLEE